MSDHECIVCGTTDKLLSYYDISCMVTVCHHHWLVLDKERQETGGTIKERLRKLGVKFEGEEEPMDVGLSDEEFCRQCGIKKPEPWEMWAASNDITNEKLGQMTLPEYPKPKKKKK